MKYYKGNITPEPGTIFVFGSNPEGRHGAGSARIAVMQFGAKYGLGEGLQGQAYALPTTELRWDHRYSVEHSMSLDEITEHIKRMYYCAKCNPELNFKVAYRNKLNERTLCGYTGAELQSAFKAAGSIPDNVWFSEEWYNSGNLE